MNLKRIIYTQNHLTSLVNDLKKLAYDILDWIFCDGI